MWIFFRGRLVGPLEYWEVKLIQSKYKNFFIFTVDKDWVHHDRMKTEYETRKQKPDFLPSAAAICWHEQLLFFRRKILRDTH